MQSYMHKCLEQCCRGGACWEAQWASLFKLTNTWSVIVAAENKLSSHEDQLRPHVVVHFSQRQLTWPQLQFLSLLWGDNFIWFLFCGKSHRDEFCQNSGNIGIVSKWVSGKNGAC